MCEGSMHARVLPPLCVSAVSRRSLRALLADALDASRTHLPPQRLLPRCSLTTCGNPLPPHTHTYSPARARTPAPRTQLRRACTGFIALPWRLRAAVRSSEAHTTQRQRTQVQSRRSLVGPALGNQLPPPPLPALKAKAVAPSRCASELSCVAGRRSGRDASSSQPPLVL